MLMQVFKRGEGCGSGPIDYITDDNGLYFDDNGKIIKDEFGVSLTYEREPRPVVLSGDIKQAKEIIDSLDFKYKYTSGVLSWSPDEVVTPEVEQAVMADFERLAFAGLDQDRYSIVWVRHSHAGHHELHFVVPRVELSTGKSLNIAPPGYKDTFDPWRTMWNIQQDWSDPTDPMRARDLGKPNFDSPDRKALREDVHAYVSTLVMAGDIVDRDTLMSHLQDAGLKISRAGDSYISIYHPSNPELKAKLKGAFYDKDFSRDTYFELEAKSGTDAGSSKREATTRLAELESELVRIFEARKHYNLRSYTESKSRNISSDEDQNISNEITDFDITGDSSLSGHLKRALGVHAVSYEYGGGTASNKRSSTAIQSNAIKLQRDSVHKDKSSTKVLYGDGRGISAADPQKMNIDNLVNQSQLTDDEIRLR